MCPGCIGRSYWKPLPVAAINVVVGIVFPVLAAVLASPVHPGQKQTAPSTSCPRPQLFETWIAVSAVAALVFGIIDQYTRRLKLLANKLRRQNNAHGQAEQAVGHATQAATLASTAASPILPQPVPIHHHQHSTPTLNSPTSPNASSAALTLIGSSNKKTEHSDVAMGSATSSTPSLSTTVSALPNVAQHESIPPPQPPALPASNPPTTLSPATPPNNPPERSESTSLEAAQDKADTWQRYGTGLHIVRLVLMILGVILLFRPSPLSQASCYKSAPMLWWGIFAMIVYDWMCIVAWGSLSIIGILILASDCFTSRRQQRRRAPPVPPPGNMRQRSPFNPTPLVTTEILRCRTVCYVPDPADPVSDDGHSVGGDVVIPTAIDPSRLPYPPVVIPSHRAICGVCQENFKSPRETLRIMYKVQELRQLPCEHVFHQECVDQWLMDHSDMCPYCNQSVRLGLEKEVEVARSAAASRASLNYPATAASESQTSLPMAMASRNASRTSSLGITTLLESRPLSTKPPRASSASPVSHSAAASRTSLGFSASRTSLPYTSPTAGASRASLPYTSPAAGASRTSLGYPGPSTSRTSLQYPARTSRSHTSSPSSPYSMPHAASRSSLGLGMASAMASRTSLASDSEGYNIPLSTSRSPTGVNAASGSRIAPLYAHPGSSRTSLTSPVSPSSPSPATTPTLGSRQLVLYPSAAASRTSLGPLPEGQTTDEAIPPLPSIPGSVGHAM